MLFYTLYLLDLIRIIGAWPFKGAIPLRYMKKMKCYDCKKEFESTSNARFPRKYCPTCSAKKKKLWDNQWKVKFEDLDD